MTVIAAIEDTDGSILLGSDSEANDGAVLFHMQKLRQLDDLPVAWGVADNAQVGLQDFAIWLRLQEWPIQDWDVFTNSARSALSEINGKARADARKAGLEPTESHVADVLLVTNFGEPHILSLGKDAAAFSVPSGHLEAIGSGGVHAKIAYAALSRVLPDIPTKMALAIEVAIQTADGCGGIGALWRMTTDGVDKEVIKGIQDAKKTN